MKLSVFVLLSYLACCNYAVSAHECMKGPTYWCQQNALTAKTCGFTKFCDAISIKPLKDDIVQVDVTFYYESLSPGCKNTLSQQLFPTFLKLKSSGILNIIFVPYGNAKEIWDGKKWKFYCQHGAAECEGNLIETCALHLYPDTNQQVPFIHCLEYYGPTRTNAQYCASMAQMNYDAIDSCMVSDVGNSLQHEMAVKTYSLNPPHQFVPWYTLNGVHTDEIQRNLSNNMLQTVCNAYTGTKPAACINGY